MPGYAVVDVETTGLFPGGQDRIVEVAVVHVSPTGEPEGSWTTLLNPQRDLGPQHIHRITAADVLGAPSFDQVAGTLAGLLAGRVFVAHNASFDMRFIRAAYEGLGYDIPVVPETSLCTMRWASQLLPQASRSLAGCCEYAGIVLDGAHAALVDATATAELLRHYLTLVGVTARNPWASPPWADVLELVGTVRWPAIPAHDVACCFRGSAAAQMEIPFLTRLVEHLPTARGPVEHQEYLALLDRALLDRFLSVRERDALVGLAGSLGIDRQTAARLHREYLAALARAALTDGEVTDGEVTDLVTVATLLGLSEEQALAALHETARAEVTCAGGSDDAALAACGFRLSPGDRVVFTGDMSLPREVWMGRAADAGLVPHPSVTKGVALVVAADPDSLSGKARKAASYGIPIVTEQAFAGMLARMAHAEAAR